MPQFNDPPTHVDWFPDGDPYLPENRGNEVSELIRREDPHQTYDCLFMKDFVSIREINLNLLFSGADYLLKPVGNSNGEILQFNDDFTLEEMGYESFDRSQIVYTPRGNLLNVAISPLFTSEDALYFERVDYQPDIPHADRYSEKMLLAFWFYGITTGNTYFLDLTGNSAIDEMLSTSNGLTNVPRYIEIPLFEKGITYFSYYTKGGDLVKNPVSSPRPFTYKFDRKDVLMYSVVVSGANADIAESLLSGTQMLYSAIEDFNPSISDNVFTYKSKRRRTKTVTPVVKDVPTQYFTFQYATRALWRRNQRTVRGLIPLTLFTTGVTFSEPVVAQPVYYRDLNSDSPNIEDRYVAEELQINGVDGATHSISRQTVSFESESVIEEQDLMLFAKAITLEYGGINASHFGYKLNPYEDANGMDLGTYINQVGTFVTGNEYQITEQDYQLLENAIYNGVVWLPTDVGVIQANVLGDEQLEYVSKTTVFEFTVEDASPFGAFNSRFYTVEGVIFQTLTAQYASTLTGQYNTLPVGSAELSDLPFNENDQVARVKIPDLELTKLRAKERSVGTTDNYPKRTREWVDIDVLKKVPREDYRKGLDIINWTWQGYTDVKELRKQMPDSKRIKEIHLALEAQKFATYESTDGGEEKARTANVGQYVELIAVALGINMLADGTPYKPKEPIRQSLVDDDTNNTVAVEAGYRFGFWGALEREPITEEQITFGDTTLTTDAPMEADEVRLVYEAFSNQFKIDDATGEATAIEPSGLMLVHNIPQLYRQILDDFDKALGLQESAAFALRSVEDIQVQDPNSNQTTFANKICTYEGLHSLVAEIAYMLSEISRRSSGAQVSSMINTALLYELMGITGLPIEPKSFTAKIGIEQNTGEDVKSQIYHPAFSDNSPRLFELWTILMQNIAPLLGDKFTLSDENVQAIKNASPDELQEIIDEIKQEISGGGN